MPASNHSKDLCVCENSRNGNNDENGDKSSKNDANRLRKLEKEVCRLRDEIDKIKWQRAAAETAIERAIVRGEAALGGRYKILVPCETSENRDNREDRKMNNRTTRPIAFSGNGGRGGNDTEINGKRGKENVCASSEMRTRVSVRKRVWIREDTGEESETEARTEESNEEKGLQREDEIGEALVLS